MAWVLGVLVLLAAAVVLRRVLALDPLTTRGAMSLLALTPDRDAIYQPIAQEIETQAAILSISLNDAIDERDSGHNEIAWRLVRLSVSEWDRLSEILTILLNVVSEHMGSARMVIPVRGMVSQRFKSRTMIDYLRMHELLDQLVFRSKMRFQLHVRVLRRGAETLTIEFRRAYRYAERTEDRPPELWHKLDLYFHDFDLVIKESLLAFRAFLVCLPHSTLSGFAAQLRPVVRHGVRTTSAAADR